MEDTRAIKVESVTEGAVSSELGPAREASGMRATANQR